MKTPLSDERFVLDTWPVMEWYRRREPGASGFEALLRSAEMQQIHLHMSRLNLGEAFYSVAKVFGRDHAEAFKKSLQFLPIRIEPVSDADVDQTAEFKAGFTLSYADAFAAALANRLGAGLATGDRDFLALAAADLLTVRWLGA